MPRDGFDLTRSAHLDVSANRSLARIAGVGLLLWLGGRLPEGDIPVFALFSQLVVRLRTARRTRRQESQEEGEGGRANP